jgi:hypothetical protein
MIIRFLSALTILSGFLWGTAHCQEFGAIETFGPEGRLFSSGRNDYYLVSRRSYATEDSSGYEGEVRKVKKFDGGGFEIEMKEFIARCYAPFDGMMFVAWFEPGQKDTGEGHHVDIKNAAKFPGDAKKDSYNLFWAACHKQFRKFK